MRTCLIAMVMSLSATAPVLAQPAARLGAALVHADGDVQLDGRSVASNALPLALGGALVGTRGGRAAIALERGGLVLLDAGSTVRVSRRDTAVDQIELLAGSAIVISGTARPHVECERDIELRDAGTYRFDLQPRSSAGERPCQARVFDGAATVTLATVVANLRAGQTMTIIWECGDMLPTKEFSREPAGDFEQWASRLRERMGI